MLPSVAIIGRPNVGKSSLLNALAGRRISIVEPTAGVTRDRVAAAVEHEGRRFELVDTGGLGLVDEVLLREHVEAQIEVAIEQADLILFLVDAKAGVTPMDRAVAERLRRVGKPVLLVANKVEGRRDEFEAAGTGALGYGEPLPISAQERYGLHDLLDRIVAMLPPRAEEPPEPEGVKVAIVGKRNSGKSSLVNWLAGGERVIVSELPGTTRDAVDVAFERGGRRWVAIDTAGARRRTRIQDAIEFFSLARSEQSVRRADVVILLFDLTEKLSEVDKKLADVILEAHKPCLLVGNKLDLARAAGVEPAAYEDYVRQQLAGLSYAPITFVSAKDGTNVEPTLAVCGELCDQAGISVATPELNRVLQAARAKNAPSRGGKLPKMFYGTQIRVRPPTILLFVNEPSLFDARYDRYLQRQLREALPWKEIPIRIVYRRREKVELE